MIIFAVKIVLMQYLETEIKGVWVIEPKVFKDARGYFMETYRQEDFDANVGPTVFVQDNESRSSYGVVRGLHYQKGEWSQAKLVRVLQGKVLDVAVDLRRSSATFGKYVAVELSDENKRQLFIPRGFAHGFAVLSDIAVFAYKVDNKYMPSAEAGIRFDDPAIGIDWPIAKEDMLLSEKDRTAVSLKDAEVF
jgi:dTDP-4-dehydrorhamnose 3,5-epimerase